MGPVPQGVGSRAVVADLFGQLDVLLDVLGHLADAAGIGAPGLGAVHIENIFIEPGAQAPVE